MGTRLSAGALRPGRGAPGGVRALDPRVSALSMALPVTRSGAWGPDLQNESGSRSNDVCPGDTVTHATQMQDLPRWSFPKNLSAVTQTVSPLLEGDRVAEAAAAGSRLNSRVRAASSSAGAGQQSMSSTLDCVRSSASFFRFLGIKSFKKREREREMWSDGPVSKYTDSLCVGAPVNPRRAPRKQAECTGALARGRRPGTATRADAARSAAPLPGRTRFHSKEALRLLSGTADCQLWGR